MDKSVSLDRGKGREKNLASFMHPNKNKKLRKSKLSTIISERV